MSHRDVVVSEIRRGELGEYILRFEGEEKANYPEKCEGIRIIPYWLFRCGFEVTDREIIGEPRKRSYKTFTLGSFSVDQNEDSDRYPAVAHWYSFSYDGDSGDMETELMFIHQLQNLYHALTGKELTLTK